MGTQALRHYLDSGFWDWTNGSALLLWRWVSEFQTAARDGFPVCFSGTPPANLHRTRKIPLDLHHIMWSKIHKFLSCNYLVVVIMAKVGNITNCFAVPKEKDDIRMVFNGTCSGFTTVLWMPSFWLPNASSMLRTVSFGHRAVDIDLGEYFINPPLNKDLQSLSTVDLSQFKTEINKEFPELFKNLDKERSGRILACW